jgi:hypothetical protein
MKYVTVAYRRSVLMRVFVRRLLQICSPHVRQFAVEMANSQTVGRRRSSTIVRDEQDTSYLVEICRGCVAKIPRHLALYLCLSPRAYVYSPPIRYEWRGGGPKRRILDTNALRPASDKSDAWRYDTRKNEIRLRVGFAPSLLLE